MAATIPDEFLDRMSEKVPMLSDSTRLAILRTLMQGVPGTPYLVPKN